MWPGPGSPLPTGELLGVAFSARGLRWHVPSLFAPTHSPFPHLGPTKDPLVMAPCLPIASGSLPTWEIFLTFSTSGALPSEIPLGPSVEGRVHTLHVCGTGTIPVGGDYNYSLWNRRLSTHDLVQA